MKRHLLCHLLVMLSATAMAEPRWDIPDPAAAEHPGAETAPSSSPTTYPDAEGFAERARFVLEGVADGGLDKWRRGYFAGGDPGKYLPGHAMAKLLIGEDRGQVVKYMNDDRSYKEHYHFAAVNWARFYPLFGEAILTDDTKQKLAQSAGNYDAYLLGGGTENHKTMWWTTANVLPLYIEGDRFAKRSKEKALADARQHLRTYVSKLYDAGAGEWDSSTYTMFTVNGLMNIYDFAEDEETRLLAKAGLDLLVSGYALKYTDGLFCGPNQRGFYTEPHRSITDQTGYVWFGSDAPLTHEDARHFRYSVHAITSAYRPNRVIVNLARKHLAGLPATQRNRKANYWHGHHADARLSTHETIHLDKAFTMGSLWDGHASQHTRFQIAVPTDKGAVSFTGGHPRKSDHTGKKTGLGFRDGNGRYLQSAQVGSTYLAMAVAPADEEAQYTFFRFPSGSEPQTFEGWHTFGVGRAVIAVRPIHADAGPPEVVEQEDKKGTVKMLRFPGRVSGFVVEVMPRLDPVELAKRISATRLEADKLNDDLSFTYRNAAGKTIGFTFNPDPQGDKHGDRLAHVTIDGEALAMNWPAVWGGPFVTLRDRVLRVTDGRGGFEIDFTGDLPAYKEWRP